MNAKSFRWLLACLLLAAPLRAATGDPVSIQLRSPRGGLAVGSTTQLQVVGTFADGSTADLTAAATGTTYAAAILDEDNPVLTVDADGLASALRPGLQIAAASIATCYFEADENDYSGPTVTNQHGLTGTYVESFLHAVQVQGSGRTAGGDLIQIDFSRGNYRNFATLYFHVVAQIKTASGQPLTAGTSIAVSSIIQLGSTVNVGGGIGTRRADDTGGKITGYHIDVYSGFGLASCNGWSNPIVPIEGY